MTAIEPLQHIEEAPEFIAIVEKLGATPEQALDLAVAFKAIGCDVIKLLVGEFVDSVDAAVIELAYRHKEDEPSLAAIRRLQAAVYAIRGKATAAIR